VSGNYSTQHCVGATRLTFAQLKRPQGNSRSIGMQCSHHMGQSIPNKTGGSLTGMHPLACMQGAPAFAAPMAPASCIACAWISMDIWCALRLAAHKWLQATWGAPPGSHNTAHGVCAHLQLPTLDMDHMNSMFVGPASLRRLMEEHVHLLPVHSWLA
jgi:hypothetical protein